MGEIKYANGPGKYVLYDPFRENGLWAMLRSELAYLASILTVNAEEFRPCSLCKLKEVENKGHFALYSPF